MNDNATTLKFDDADVKLAFKESTVSWTRITEALAESGIAWHFIPPISGDLDYLEALTAGHLFIGGLLNLIPDVGLTPDKIDHLTHWKLVRGLRDRFWEQWSREYLNTLQQRQKWTRQRPNLRIGDLVVVIDSTLLRPNKQWPLGRAVDTSYGRSSQLLRTASFEPPRSGLRRGSMFGRSSGSPSFQSVSRKRTVSILLPSVA